MPACSGEALAGIWAALDRACSPPQPNSSVAGCSPAASCQEVLEALPQVSGIRLEACRAMSTSVVQMVEAYEKVPALGVPVHVVRVEEFAAGFDRTVLAVLDFAYAATRCAQPHNDAWVAAPLACAPVSMPPSLRAKLMARVYRTRGLRTPSASHAFDPTAHHERMRARLKACLLSNDSDPLLAMIAGARNRTGYLKPASGVATVGAAAPPAAVSLAQLRPTEISGPNAADIATHQFLFVGGLPRSFTTAAVAMLRGAPGVSTQSVLNYTREACKVDQPWMRGLGTNQAAFERNSGGVEGKMVTDAYGEYIEFLALFCNRFKGAKNCTERNISAFTNRRAEPATRYAVRSRMFAQWAPFWNLSNPVLVEKTPENMLVAPFLQDVFGPSRTHFWFTMRHPLVWALAVDKWVRNPGSSIFNIADRVGAWVQA